MKVPRRFQATPICSINAMPPAACVGSEHDQKPPRLKESPAFLQHSEGIGDMFNKMNPCDCIKRLIREPLICQCPKVHRNASFSRASHRRGIEIDALDLPSELFHRLKRCAAATAYFE